MTDEKYMQKALQLAEKGKGSVAPNPMVGCVIVYNQNIVASGYHKKYGDAHAEVNAINALSNTINPKDCILFVTLEPCSHHGKTPPCADLIAKKGFKKVVVCNLDPNPLVAGNGINKLKEANIEVIQGVLEQKGRNLNRRFFTFFEKKRPYYIIKWAQTADGFISHLPIPSNKESNKISGIESQKIVHQLRAEEMAIMVGKNTVLNDNPSLTTRLVYGKNPIRIVIDKNLEINSTYNIFNSEAKTIVFNSFKDEEVSNIHFIKLNFKETILDQISQKLYVLNVQSVLVEGGAILINDFIQQKIVDEILVFENPNLNFRTGIKAPSIKLPADFSWVGKDKLYHLFDNNPQKPNF